MIIRYTSSHRRVACEQALGSFWGKKIAKGKAFHFDCLEDVYIIFIQQMRYKNSHKQRLHK